MNDHQDRLDRFLRLWHRAAQRPVLSTGGIALAAVMAAYVVTRVAGVPEPQVHDEQAQLVMADIFAHGRLCEPPHEYWEHFEAIHVLSQPCYQGKYSPGLALFMALGIVAFGQPISGIWIAVGVMVVCAAYALYAWLPHQWALLATSLIALRFGIVGEWAQAYWGGAASAAAGALVVGGIRNSIATQSSIHGAATGTGLVLLAITRPYEGLILAVVAVTLELRSLAGVVRARTDWWRTPLTALTIVVLGAMWMSYYNYRVTGSATTLPYSLYERTHSVLPLFIWQDARRESPPLRQPEMRRYENEMARELERNRRRFPFQRVDELALVLWTFVKPFLGFALVGLLWTPPGLRSAARYSMAVICAVLGSNLVTSWTAARYVGPATVPIFLLVSIGLAGFVHRWERRPAIVLLLTLMLGSSVGATTVVAARHMLHRDVGSPWWQCKKAITQQLQASVGDDLVFVQYGPDHNPNNGWIDNGADIDTQPIIWARQIDADSDRRLRNYYRSRRAWIVIADAQPPRLIPWSPGSE